MAQNDIYNNKQRYEHFIDYYIKERHILDQPEGKRKYYCKNKVNFNYYDKLIRTFEVDDLSYMRRNRLFYVANFLFSFIDYDIKMLT